MTTPSKFRVCESCRSLKASQPFLEIVPFSFLLNNAVDNPSVPIRTKPRLSAGWYEDNWFEVNLEEEDIECSVDEMKEAAEGHLTTEALMWNQNLNERTISGMTSEDFRLRLNQVLRKEGYKIDNQRFPEGYQEAPLAYDAVWSVALGTVGDPDFDRCPSYLVIFCSQLSTRRWTASTSTGRA